MKNILLLSTSLFLAATAFGQTVTDSVSVGTGSPSYRLDVYYSLVNGMVDTVPNNNWHLAFATRNAQPPMDALRGATVRFNEARGVKVMKSSQSNWSTFDSTGWMGWPVMHDNDSDFTKGGFNMGTSGFNFGWGTYDMVSHHVNGSVIFLVSYPSGSSTAWKKIWINRLAYDTTWIFTTANLDGSDSVTTTFDKSAYAGKLFAYYNLDSKQVLDREPAAQWDMLFTRYVTAVNLMGVDTFYPVSGVLLHPTVTSARVQGVDENTVTPAGAGLYSGRANTIGWDWKVAPMGPPPAGWSVVDSLAFFVKRGSIDHRVVFTRFDGASTGKIVFNTTEFNTTGLNEAASRISSLMYPNPASSSVQVSFGRNVVAGQVSVYNTSGRLMMQVPVRNLDQVTLGVENLGAGLYMVVTEADGESAATKLLVH